MDLNAVLLLVAGVVAPLLNALLKQPVWSSKVNWLVSTATALGAGSVVEFIADGTLTSDELVAAGTTVFLVGQAFYMLIFKNSGLNAFLERLFVRKPAPVELEEVEPAAHDSAPEDVVVEGDEA